MFHKYQHKHKQNLYLSTFFRMLTAEAKSVRLPAQLPLFFIFSEIINPTQPGVHTLEVIILLHSSSACCQFWMDYVLFAFLLL